MENPITPFDLNVRCQIYRFFAERYRAPSYQEIAGLMQAKESGVREAFHQLHRQHMIFLENGSDLIRMANPFSAIPTRFRVRAGAAAWWANCAWDALGIAAALQIDVQIAAGTPDSAGTVELRVENGGVDGKQQVIYFPLPCRQWYDDLVFT
jgi:hypothetical protein